MALSGSLAWAAPQGGKVVAGQANISHNGKITNINQSSQRAAINWQKFGVKADETVNFKQPNAQSITLNRVIGNEKSVINGAMNANGKVFLVNPHGTIIGKNAKINVGGLVASTADISNDDFMKGNYRFKGKGLGEIENLGEITVPEGGVVALIAPIVKNKGKIKAEKASVLLASAQNFSITLPENEDFAYTIDKGTLEGLIDNGGAILADGGLVVLTAEGIDAVKKSVIRHSGLIQANTVLEKDGKILLLGDQSNSKLELTGTLKAEAPVFGNGGFIETSASEVKIADSAKVSTKAKNGKTGEWLIDPADFTIAKTNGDMTGTAVSVALKDNNFTVFSSKGKNSNGNGNINVDDTITWNNNTLRLNADNSIYFNTTISATGNGKLDLRYGQATDDGGDSNYHLAKDVRINLPEGQNFSTKKGSSGEVVNYEVIHKMPDITTINSTSRSVYSKSTPLSNNTAIGIDINLDYTKNYTDFNGWEISSGNSVNIAGLGHKIYDLHLSVGRDSSSPHKHYGFIVPNDYSGTISSSSINVDNLHLNNLDIAYTGSGGVGGIISSVNFEKNSDFDDFNVSIRNNSVSGNIYSGGGIVGAIKIPAKKNANITIENNYADVNISNNGGGIVSSINRNSGWEWLQNNSSINILNNYANVNITGLYDTGGIAGYITGENIILKNNRVDGKITGRSDGIKVYSKLFYEDYGSIGGLVGTIPNTYDKETVIENSHSNASINVEKISGSYGTFGVGGLVGRVYGNATIRNSSNSGEITTQVTSFVGGLIGKTGVVRKYLDNETYEENKTIKIVNSNNSGNITVAADNTEIVSVGGLIGGGNGFYGSHRNKYGADYIGVTSLGYWRKPIPNWIYHLPSSADVEISKSYSTGNIINLSENTKAKLNNAGGLIGEAESAKIDNSYATGKIVASNEVGGLIGRSGNSFISNSYANTDIISKGLHIGGLIGGNYGDFSISNSYAIGTINDDWGHSGYLNAIGGLIGYYGGNGDSYIKNSFSDNIIHSAEGSSGIGGLIGRVYLYDNKKKGINIINSYSKSEITGSKDLGGFIGNIGSYKSESKKNEKANFNLLVQDSFFSGNITQHEDTINWIKSGLDKGDYIHNSNGDIIKKTDNSLVYQDAKIGGILGNATLYNDSNNIIMDNVYVSGNINFEKEYNRNVDQVFGNIYAGSVGADSTTFISLNNLYIDSDITNSKKIDNGFEPYISGRAVSLTKEQMKNQDSFKGFDFNDVWEIKEGQTPTLKNKTTDAWDFENVWEIKEGEKNPTLRPAKDTIMIINPVIDTGDDTGGDNTGGDNTGGDNTGGDNTGGDNTGGDNTGGDNIGGDNTGGDNTGGDNTGGDNTGGDNTGGDKTDGDKTDEEKTDDDEILTEEEVEERNDMEWNYIVTKTTLYGDLEKEKKTFEFSEEELYKTFDYRYKYDEAGNSEKEVQGIVQKIRNNYKYQWLNSWSDEKLSDLVRGVLVSFSKFRGDFNTSAYQVSDIVYALLDYRNFMNNIDSELQPYFNMDIPDVLSYQYGWGGFGKMAEYSVADAVKYDVATNVMLNKFWREYRLPSNDKMLSSVSVNSEALSNAQTAYSNMESLNTDLQNVKDDKGDKYIRDLIANGFHIFNTALDEYAEPMADAVGVGAEIKFITDGLQWAGNMVTSAYQRALPDDFWDTTYDFGKSTINFLIGKFMDEGSTKKLAQKLADIGINVTDTLNDIYVIYDRLEQASALIAQLNAINAFPEEQLSKYEKEHYKLLFDNQVRRCGFESVEAALDAYKNVYNVTKTLNELLAEDESISNATGNIVDYGDGVKVEIIKFEDSIAEGLEVVKKGGEVIKTLVVGGVAILQDAADLWNGMELSHKEKQFNLIKDMEIQYADFLENLFVSLGQEAVMDMQKAKSEQFGREITPANVSIKK